MRNFTSRFPFICFQKGFPTGFSVTSSTVVAINSPWKRAVAAASRRAAEAIRSKSPQTIAGGDTLDFITFNPHTSSRTLGKSIAILANLYCSSDFPQPSQPPGIRQGGVTLYHGRSRYALCPSNNDRATVLFGWRDCHSREHSYGMRRVRSGR